ncbi:LacI family DNA-binding transcriptional regulator [Bifidobacterium sp.]|jgi:DNA-binding LacI/PurR family transcriptional regulator|uniref:LacI family DNA-binding transcriptional regulator n=1 Tax=Bifidobacterium sp. TaxID=41200 RepID=UPI0025BF2628|nr:LacI family DNA-binding transcriptional regulator [Bifidobacterium sp.]MCI1636312.1 LacI family DNA-binding transcriptional regulator [Bifidobacterium sp.]
MSGATGRSGKRPSIFEVAKLAGVSHQTVSRVINHSPDVSVFTRTKVQSAIDKLGYRPSNSARALASHRSRTIGLIAGGVSFFGPISTIAAIESTARAHGLFLSIAMVDEARCTRKDFEDVCGTLIAQNVEAFIFITPTDIMFEAACNAKIPQPRVLVTSTHGAGVRSNSALRKLSGKNAAIVGVDQWYAMHEVATLLHRLGHRSAWYLAGPSEWRDASTRLAAWKQSCTEFSIDSKTIVTQSWDASEAYARINHLLEDSGERGASLPTVIVTANDNQAIGVTRALHEHGIRIPTDMSLVGFDDIPAADSLYPPLTTVQPHFEQLGRTATQEVLALLGEISGPATPRMRHGIGLIPATVVQRNSLAPAPRR